MIERRDPDLVGILKDSNNLILNANNCLTDIIFKLNPKIKENTETLKKQFEEALKNTDYFKTKEFEEKISFLQKEKDFLLSQSEIDKNMLKDRIMHLESENKIMTEKIMRKAKNAISDSVIYEGFKINNQNSKILNSNNKKNSDSNTFTKNNLNAQNNNNINKSTNLNNSQEDNLYNSNNDLPNNEYTNNQKPNTSNILFNSNSMQNESIGNINKSKSNVIIGPVNCRVLTKNMLLDLIQEIYDSKSQIDQKCQEQGIPKETMEQHMYTFLNHKYGLKNLIIEWASSIINGIRMFSAEDSEVCLFGKILRNELEEEARLIIAKMKTTISELLVYFLKAKFPLKISNEIKQMADNKMNGLLNEDEWKGIIYNVYEKQDADLLNSKIEEFIRTNILGVIKKNQMKK